MDKEEKKKRRKGVRVPRGMTIVGNREGGSWSVDARAQEASPLGARTPTCTAPRPAVGVYSGKPASKKPLQGSQEKSSQS